MRSLSGTRRGFGSPARTQILTLCTRRGTRLRRRDAADDTTFDFADGEAKSKQHQDDNYFPRTERGHFTTLLHRDILHRTT
jgi:hypothetical protein